MQYVGKVGGYVYNQWNALNPATLLGAIDIIVVEQPDGSLHCSPWHIRFGKFQIIRPLQKKIDLYVNDIKTDLPMKLGDGGEACFVFETADHNMVSKSVLTSPVISPSSSAEGSPLGSPNEVSPSSSTFDLGHGEPEALDLNEHSNKPNDDDIENKVKLTDSNSPVTRSPSKSATPNSALHLRITFEKARKITQQLNIPSKIDINGDMVLDMDGYKPNSQKNIDVSDEYFKKIFLQELMDLTNSNKDGENSDHEYNFLDQIVSKDEDGNIRILNNNAIEDEMNLADDLTNNEGLVRVSSNEESPLDTATSNEDSRQHGDKTYFKTLRLTSEQLQKMNLHYGENKLKFKLNQANSQIESNLYLWKSTTPIVISDIDGTITKSDALGHVLNLIGRDWTHPGVANLFQDIKSNGYNIIYLTARSVGQADSTRQYLKGIVQDGNIKLPRGPVILSPDRTMAALRREVILKKPEVFKMSCLNDIKSLYFSSKDLSHDDDITPFYAGFGNRITDAISYRSVKIPSHRIFTINPNGEVHMELLELAGYKSSYMYIGELVDHFFPPIKAMNTLNAYWNANQFNQYINNTKEFSPPGSPGVRSIDNFDGDSMLAIKTDERYNDVNYWREPLANLSDLSDLDVEGDDDLVNESKLKSPKPPTLLSIRGSDNDTATPTKVERPTSASSFTSPLKNFMFNHHENSSSPTTLSSNLARNPDDTIITNDSDYTNDYDDDDDDDDYTDDGYDDEDDYEDDYDDDEEDVDDGAEDLDGLEDEELDDEDLDHDLRHGFEHANDSPSPVSPKLSPVPPILDPLTKSKSNNGSNNETNNDAENDANEESNSQFVKASDLMNKLSL